MKQKFQIIRCLSMFLSFSLLVLAFFSCNLIEKVDEAEKLAKNKSIAKAKTEIELSTKAITAGKTAVQTANEKNTRAKEVKVEDEKLILESLIKNVSDKTEALKLAKNALANFESLTPEQIKTQTASLKQTRIELEAETTKLTATFANLDAEIADKEPAMPLLQGQDEKGNPIVVSTKEGKSISHEDLMEFKNKEENKNKVLNTEKINVTFNVFTPSKLNEFFENFTHLNIDISNETEFISNDTQELGADGKLQYFQASKLAELVEKINFVENPQSTSQKSLAKAPPLSKCKKIKGNMIICDTFSRFDGDDDDYTRELEAFITDSYQKYDGTVIPRTRTWITFSQLTRLIRWLKKYEFLNNTVRFGDMLVVKKRERDRDVLNCLDAIINENIERFELKNKAGEERSIKFAGRSIRCYMILNGYKPYTEITVEQLLQISKRCRWRHQRILNGNIEDLPFEHMALRFKIKNLNCKKLSADDLKDLTFQQAWFAGRFEGEDTDLSDISFKGASSTVAGLVTFTGVLPKDMSGATCSWLIIRDAEIPNFDVQDEYIDWDDEEPVVREARNGMACLPSAIGNLIVHNLKGLDRICKDLTKKNISKLHYERKFDFSCFCTIYSSALMGDGIKIGSFVGSGEVYKEFDRLCAFRMREYQEWDAEPIYGGTFVCFTDKNNNILKGPYNRKPDWFKVKRYGNEWEYVENTELTPVPLANYKQDENGFFEKINE